MANFWLYQSTISQAFGSYLFVSHFNYSPFAILAATALSLLTDVVRGSELYGSELATVAVAHQLFSHLALNWALASVLILNAIPFILFHIAYLVDRRAIRRPPLLDARRYMLIVTKYLISIRCLIVDWEDEDMMEVDHFYIATVMILIGSSTFSFYLRNVHP